METFWKVCSVDGQGVISDWQVWNWFAKFWSGKISLEDESLNFDDETLKSWVGSKIYGKIIGK